MGTASSGLGRWGQLDLSGNVGEWTLDRGNTDIASPYRSPCVDCAEANVAVGKGNGRANRGGTYSGSLALAPQRNPSDPPLYRSPGIGFRCARTPSLETWVATPSAGTIRYPYPLPKVAEVAGHPPVVVLDFRD